MRNRIVKKYSDEQIAAAEGALLAGMSVQEVSDHYGIGRSTVGNIKRNMALRRLENNETPKVSIDELLQKSLDLHLRAIGQIAELALDKDWLRGQRASELSALHATLEGHAIRLLQSCAPAEETEEY